MSETARNRLQYEGSPYLQQHAENPVDWFPWGDEAISKAKQENKPILLSVGYSACHWCHVMAHECFENERVSGLMNEGFVNIKVDREERPDVDEVYQRVTQLITGQGGWPLTVFLTPDLKPIYGGTYFPPTDWQGRPGFPRVMEAVLDAYRNRRDEAEEGARQLIERMRLIDDVRTGTHILPRETLGDAENILRHNFDGANGGFGSAPKFPMVSDHELLLARYRATGDRQTLGMVLYTLQKMATGGVYDQLGGGFHRYSVDPYWLVPHFEKMLYDNALIPRLYLEAFRLTGDLGYARIVHETLGYLLREMRSPQGGFYSSQDADSEGSEGRFFVWSFEEIRELLGREKADRFAAVYGVSEEGNWEGTNILHISREPAEWAKEAGMGNEVLQEELRESAERLLEAREKREKPGRDNKHIAAWNGLALGTFAQAGALLEHPAYLDTAREAAGFLLDRFFDAERNVLMRIFHEAAKIEGFLDDYAYLAAGLLDLHRATGEEKWATAAERLARRMRERFVDSKGLLFLVPNDAEELPSRPRSGYDQMLPSPAALAVQTFWRLYVLTNDPVWKEDAERIFVAYGEEMRRNPTAYAAMLAALDLYHRGQTACVIAGASSDAQTQLLAQAARKSLPADEAVLLADQAGEIGKHLTSNKSEADGGAAAFVCEGFSCMPPATTVDELTTRFSQRP